MIISTEKKIIIYGTPRTGSSTIRDLLASLPVDLALNHDDHGGYRDVLRFIDQHPDKHFMGISNPDEYQHFAFYRDPFERCLSTINYIRRGRQCFRFFHAFYGDEIPISCAMRIPYKDQPEDVQRAIDEPPMIEVFRKFKWNMEVGVFGKTQRRWVDAPVTPLNYHDYDNEVRKLLTLLGVDSTQIEIPKTNESLGIPEIDVLSAADEAEIREYLREDYEFLASRGIRFS